MVIWENSRCSILFHLLVPGWEVADGDVQTGLGRQHRQLGLPEPVAVAVGAARVRGDQQPARAGIVGCSAGLPPASDRGDGERGGVVVDTDVHPARVGGEVVDAVGDGQRHVRSGGEEAVVFDLDRVTLRAPLPPGRG